MDGFLVCVLSNTSPHRPIYLPHVPVGLIRGDCKGVLGGFNRNRILIKLYTVGIGINRVYKGVVNKYHYFFKDDLISMSV